MTVWMNAERDRTNQRIRQTTEEFETWLRDEQTNHEDEIDMLQEEIRNKENAIQQISSNYEHDVSMRDQKLSQMDA